MELKVVFAKAGHEPIKSCNPIGMGSKRMPIVRNRSCIGHVSVEQPTVRRSRAAAVRGYNKRHNSLEAASQSPVGRPTDHVRPLAPTPLLFNSATCI